VITEASRGVRYHESFHGRSSIQWDAPACKKSQNDSFKNGIAGDAQVRHRNGPAASGATRNVLL